MKKIKQILLAACIMLAANNKSSAQIDVLICAGESNAANVTDVDHKLTATGLFNNVDVFQANTGTPTLAFLQNYDAVLVYSNVNYSNATSLGNVMQQYVDGGGGVVLMATDFNTTAARRLGGTFDNATYRVIANGGSTSGTASLGTVLLPSHPVMTGVSTFTLGSTTNRINSSTLYSGATGAYIIARYTTSSQILAAARDNAGAAGNKRRVDLNFLPSSSTVNSGFWNASTHGAKLMANALLYVACSGPVITASGSAPYCSGSTSTLSASAGTSYQWYLNSSPIPGATSQTYVAGTAGTYSVTVNAVASCNYAQVGLGDIPTITPPGPLTQCRPFTQLFTSSSSGIWLTNGSSPTVAGSLTFNAPTGITTNISNLIVIVNGCSSAPTTITALGQPDIITTTSNSPVFCTGSSLNLFASFSGAGALTYQWSGPGGFSANGQSVSRIVTSNADGGNYTVTATDNNGCTRSTLVAVSVYTTTLSGTYTVGTGGNFTSLKAAQDAYDTRCLTGPVVFELINANYNIGVDALDFRVNKTASAVNTLLIKPAVNVNTTITGFPGDIFQFRGTDYVTIDGSNNGTSSRNLTITSNSSRFDQGLIHFISLGIGQGCIYNVVKNVNLSGDFIQSDPFLHTSIPIRSGNIGASNENEDNSNNQFINNYITKAETGIAIYGNPNTNNNSNVIANNIIGPPSFGNDQISRSGILVTGQNNLIVTGNEIRFVALLFTQSNFSGDKLGIGFGGDITNSVCSGNVIHDIIDERGNSAAGIIGELSSGGNTISNNIIYNIRANSSSSNQVLGIGLTPGLNATNRVVFNSIRLAGDLDPTGTTDAAGNSVGIRIYSGGGSTSPFTTNLTLANNIVSVDFTSNNSALKHFGIVAPVASPFSWGTGFSNRNDIYVNPSNNPQMMFGGLGNGILPVTQVSSLAAWRTIFTPNQDLNSVDVQPNFVGATDLHLVAASNPLLDGGGTPIAGVTTDYDNETRNTITPDIGADEFTGTGCTNIFYEDADNDGYGNPNVTTTACTAPSGYVANDDDCNDGNNAVNPNATEICNGIDDDCDGLTDDNDPSITGQSTWYSDTDNDGFGNVASPTLACNQPSGYVSNDDDCNDGNNAVNPNATEICNGIDDDCDGLTDDNDPSITGQSTWYADADVDGFGNAAVSTLACNQPSGFVSNDDDCNDGNNAVNPNATEICNGIDDDCDGLTDDNDPSITGQSTWYADADADGFGNASVSTLACNQPSGYVSNDDDCNDANNAVNPNATEICNGIDDDCDGLIDAADPSISNMLVVNAGSDESTFFGYTGDQTVVRTAVVSGGVAPYTYSWSINRPLKCNEVTAAGDEVFSGGSCTNTICPTTGALLLNPVCTGSATVTVRLMDTTNVCVTVTDANGCIVTDCFLVMAQDVRCFAGNSNNNKVKVCHHTSSATNPWVQICVANEAVPAHLANNSGDYVGNCVQPRYANSEESEKEMLFELFPNPAHQTLNVAFTYDKESSYEIQLLDVTGRLVKSYTGTSLIGENEVQLNLEKIAKGIYQVLIIVEDKRKVKKLVVE